MVFHRIYGVEIERVSARDVASARRAGALDELCLGGAALGNTTRVGWWRASSAMSLAVPALRS